MRIVNWNCNCGKHDVKLQPLLKLHPDIAIIQETPKPRTTLAPFQSWCGVNENKGLMALGFGDYKMEEAPKANAPSYFLPVQVLHPERFNLLAIWINPKPGGKSSLTDCIKGLASGINAYSSFIESAPTLIVGDFNVPPPLDMEARFNLVSCYHEFTGLAFGAERQTTHFHKKKNDGRIFHYDYCFVPRSWCRRISNVAVGSFDQWTKDSDHSPLIIEIQEQNAPVVRDAESPQRYDEKILRELFSLLFIFGECEGCHENAVEIKIGDIYQARVRNYTKKSIDKTVLEDFPQLCIDCQEKKGAGSRSK